MFLYEAILSKTIEEIKVLRQKCAPVKGIAK